MKRKLWLTIGLFLTMLAISAFAAPSGAKGLPDVIPLPDGFQPEGIVIGRGLTAYAGSLADGDIYEVDLRTGEGETLVEGPGTPAVGLSFDRRTGYLYVAGGPAGTARVYNTRSGELVADYDFGGAFVNDVIVTRKAAFFTDSFAPVLYKVDLDRRGRLPGSFSTLPLGGDFTQIDGFNANGIEATPNGKTLFVVHSSLGIIYRVDPDTGNATEIDLGGESAGNGDGLLLVGRKLYVVRNFINQVSEFRLNHDYSAATLTKVITSDNFDIPTTVDNRGSSLYLVNARFTTPPGPTVTYDIVRVKR